MQTKKNLLAFVAIAVLVGAVAYPTTSDVIGQIYDPKKRVDSSSTNIDTKDRKGNSLMQRVSTEASPTTFDDEEDDDLNEIGGDILEAGNNTEQGETEGENEYTTSFRAEDCTFSSTGRNPFFILEPNYQLVLAGGDASEAAEVMITVLNETRQVNGTETRVIEERESIGGELVEISRNFFAICEETNSIFYFGEEVDDYENGNIISHEGAWLAGEDANRAGVIMPGTILLGARYYQEIAPEVALDRAEIIDMGEVVQTPSGDFSDSLITRETTPLEPDVAELKYYAAGIGLIQEEDLMLEHYGFIE
ncbi:MAG TPA: hypothetical protein VFR94_01645 [Nitrososphaeraceae archaeon]|nr:hypothetical protein [Nitrososphaeraceae archaeon]